MTIVPVHELSAVCKSTSAEIVQAQSPALLNEEALCKVHFGICHGLRRLQQWPPELTAYHCRTFASYELFDDPADLREAPPNRRDRPLLESGITPSRMKLLSSSLSAAI